MPGTTPHDPLSISINRALQAIDKGGVVRMSGPSGSGKTVILRQVASARRTRAPLAYCAQRASATLKAGDVADALGDWEEREAGRRAVQALALAEYLDRPVRELSHGERQRVVLAAALAQDAPLCLLDEPTRHLDRAGQDALAGLLAARGRQAGRATLVTEVRPILPAEVFGCELRIGDLSGEPNLSARAPRGGSRTSASRARLEEILAPCRPGAARSLRLEGLRPARPAGAEPRSATLAPGAPWLLRGAMGTGKTTMIQTLSGLLKPREGWFGWKAEVGRQEIHQEEIGRVSADPALQLFMPTVAEEVRLGAHPAVTDEELGALYEALAGPDPHGRPALEQCPGRLALGTQIALALCTALARRPALLLCDEPTAGLDGPGLERLMAVLEVHAAQAVVVVATHDQALLGRFDQHLSLDSAPPARGAAEAACAS